jgi:hypothetical protein
MLYILNDGVAQSNSGVSDNVLICRSDRDRQHLCAVPYKFVRHKTRVIQNLDIGDFYGRGLVEKDTANSVDELRGNIADLKLEPETTEGD